MISKKATRAQNQWKKKETQIRLETPKSKCGQWGSNYRPFLLECVLKSIKGLYFCHFPRFATFLFLTLLEIGTKNANTELFFDRLKSYLKEKSILAKQLQPLFYITNTLKCKFS